MRIVLWSAAGVLAVLGLAGTVGCQKQPDPKDLGEVIYELPKVPNAQKPYQLPPEAGPLPPEPATKGPGISPNK